MKEKELRLALVCYGGASLAVYMDGIVTEFLSAVRASAFRDQPDRVDQSRPLSGSALLFKKLLDRLNEKTRLSVIIDTVSGASAGGINGIFLSRAIAHDLSLKPLRDMWLALGDVEELMKGYSLAGRFSKVYLQPVLELVARSLDDYRHLDGETKTKLMRFMRSRWFKPPFSGETMLTWMVDAALAMGQSKALSASRDHPSLMPTGHALDLFVRVTNFDGEIRAIRLDDISEKTIRERAYGKHIHFRYRRRLSGDGVTDFHDDNVPGLGFAARATSSYPGAFPAVSLRHLERHLRRRGLAWPHRATFFDHNFADQLARPGGYEELQAMNFMDGGIVDNKPFADAIAAIKTKGAQRPVDRRILFIDPLPTDAVQRSIPKPPGFFETIFGAAFRIPISQPIYNELAGIEANNEASRKEQAIIKAIQQDVSELVADLFTKDDIDRDPADDGQRFRAMTLAKGRQQGADLAYNQSGFAIGAYHHARLSDTLDQLSSLIHGLFTHNQLHVSRPAVSAAIMAWAQACGLVSSDNLRLDAGPRLQQLLDFLRSTDLNYRIRRLRRVLKRVNALKPDVSLSDQQYRKLKRRIYLGLDKAQQRAELSNRSKGLLDGINLTNNRIDSSHIGLLVDRLQACLKLEALDDEADSYLAMVLNQLGADEAQLDLFRAYVGFAFEDMMTFSSRSIAAGDDHQLVRVMRVSPLDSSYLSNGENPLLGRRLFGFGAFFSRNVRENDFLWGRLHGADRLIDAILDSAAGEGGPLDIDPDTVKREIFTAILNEEQPVLTRTSEEIEQLKRRFSPG